MSPPSTLLRLDEAMGPQASVKELVDLLGLKDGEAHGYSKIWLSEQIQDGLPFTAFERINTLVFAGQQDLARLVISPATRKRRRKDKKGLSAKSSQQLERIARVWIMAIDIYKDELMARRYLTEPHMMLRGKRPVALASTNDGGARAVQDMLGRLKYSVAL
ncbi:antitoxin Xre-like helix-turn-helix domain-containing protein [Algiphilus sp.]|uniref:antitoxin Xre-like helix-turn-helix domain-containing protein n=1 Tax=Algiphilus sp. TaxID=1872431 RepID=UPI0032EE0C64